MKHREICSCLEEYAEQTLPTSACDEVERHLVNCSDCQRSLSLILLTRNITRSNKLAEGPLPAVGFAPSVLRLIEKKLDGGYLWKPLRLIAAQFIPAMVLLAIVLGWLAYSQLSGLREHLVSDSSMVETYADLPSSWGQERAVLSDTIAQDRDQVVLILLNSQPGPSAAEEGKK